MREHILSEIRRLAASCNGKPPGKQTFARQTGISEYQWSGVIWARWGDALREAGFEENTLQGRFDENAMLSKVVEACRHYGHVPTVAEMKLYRNSVDRSFPSKGAINAHFPSQEHLLNALKQYTAQSRASHDITAMLPRQRQQSVQHRQKICYGIQGHEYLLKSGRPASRLTGIGASQTVVRMASGLS